MEENNFETSKGKPEEEKKPQKEEKSLESGIENDTKKEILKLEKNTQALQKDIESFGSEDDFQEALEENQSIMKSIKLRIDIIGASCVALGLAGGVMAMRSEEHTSELQS